MALQLYDTLTRKFRTLQAEDGERFRFYCCGPTVYGPAHIGNFRTFLLQDVFRRTLEVAGLNPYHVRQITDVDDKTIRQSQAEGVSLSEFTEKWTKRFHHDCKALNMLPPHQEPRATKHITQQIDMIKKLVEKGNAYMASDGSVYYKISSFPDYGKLTHLQNREIQNQVTNNAGEVNDADEYDRESIADFALWKARKPEDGKNFWSSPWGEGRPGWHIECSAMSTHYLGEAFDLHGGGVDLCFPHHENEIAQSEAATGKPFAYHWFHCAHLLVEDQKMSKSLSNLYTLSDIRRKGYSPMSLRYLLISGHYRQPLNFTFHGLEAAQSALHKLEKLVLFLLEEANLPKESFNDFLKPSFDQMWSNPCLARAWSDSGGICDDLNIPCALGSIFSSRKIFLAEASSASIPAQDKVEKALRGLKDFGKLLYALGLNLFTEDKEKVEVPIEIRQLAEKRWAARKAKNFTTADALREEIAAQGWKVLDRHDGYALDPAT